MAGTLMSHAAPALAMTPLVPHRAVYDLQLQDATEQSGISNMYGRMVYEFNGSACAGYTVSFRFVTKVDGGEEVRTTDQQTTTFEDPKGSFRFLTRSFTDDKLDKEVRGTAHETEKGVSVDLEAPQKQSVDLTKAMFPTAHMIDVIERALKGEKLFEARLFDGSDSGDKTMLTTTVIGARETPAGGGAGKAESDKNKEGKAEEGADDTDAEKAGTLARSPYWPVTIAYFEDHSTGDATPTYRTSFKLYENGVTRDLTLDYGDFVLSAKLAKLDLYKADGCNAPAKQAK
ncbi:ATP-binding protein [Rhizobium rhizosphaerae]|uniref:ATP-binding protein n=2 Tax=Xaviernesmea rhizosphaerae TaxID=1672749 RepID=A0ABX3PJ59_9HYPH|nr:ATP-binding protein [Xaviernesmea rhizosphaerae]